MEAYQAANELFVDEEYGEALNYYNQAVQQSACTDYLLRRSACHLKLNDPMKALQDANSALKLESSNAQAHLRKGMACFELEEYESAKEAFEASRALSDSAVVRRWIRKCDAEIKDEESGDQEIPSVSTTKPPAATSTPAAAATSKPAPTISPSAARYTPIPSRPTVRHEWYQSPTHVTITIFAKNVAKEQCKIEPTDTTLYVSIKLDEGIEFLLDLVLCDDVDASQTNISYFPTKVEIKLAKRKQCKWLNLEKTEDQIRTLDWDTSKTSTPEYPSSSKIKKNWDAISRDVEEEKPEGEQALNKLFQDIFARGSDEQKRAMEKSFVESGGTVLSTNWQDVGSRKVEGSAPKGTEVRKWSEL